MLEAEAGLDSQAEVGFITGMWVGKTCKGVLSPPKRLEWNFGCQNGGKVEGPRRLPYVCLQEEIVATEVSLERTSRRPKGPINHGLKGCDRTTLAQRCPTNLSCEPDGDQIRLHNIKKTEAFYIFTIGLTPTPARAQSSDRQHHSSAAKAARLVISSREEWRARPASRLTAPLQNSTINSPLRTPET